MKSEEILEAHVGRVTPTALINYIEKCKPELKGECLYDKKEKCLRSKHPRKYDFYYDPFHGVIVVTKIQISIREYWQRKFLIWYYNNRFFKRIGLVYPYH